MSKSNRRKKLEKKESKQIENLGFTPHPELSRLIREMSEYCMLGGGIVDFPPKLLNCCARLMLNGDFEYPSFLRIARVGNITEEHFYKEQKKKHQGKQCCSYDVSKTLDGVHYRIGFEHGD